MESQVLVTVVINNYNYAHFLAQAIDSVIEQSYENLEIIVVDDGSTDDSADIISSYGNRILPVLKQNGGQASALNEGIAKSTGEIICFLDSDDLFKKHKVETIVQLLVEIANKEVLLNHFLEVVDKDEQFLECDLVRQVLSGPGDWHFLRELSGKPAFFDGRLNCVSSPYQTLAFARKYRFLPYLGVQTSGITITRSLADKVFPLPERDIKSSADVFLVKAASLHGDIYSTDLSLAQYRIHGNNQWYGQKSCTDFSKKENFFLKLNEFLNQQMVSLEEEPVFSYFDSMSAKGHYRHCFGSQGYRKLYRLAFKVIDWHKNTLTARFFIKTLLLATYYRIKHSFSLN